MEIVRRIFDDALQGLGNYAIASRLNIDGIATFGTSDGWAKSSVANILANRAVLGEYQPCRLIQGKRIPEGSSIANYYPAILDEATFARTSNAKSKRRVGGGGRKGESYSNLFSHLCRCVYCGAPMHFVNKGKGPKGGKYLICSKSIKKGCGSAKPLRYREFETSMLTFVREVDLASIFEVTEEPSKRKALQDRVEELQGLLEELRSRKYKLTSLVTDEGVAPASIAPKLKELEVREVEANARLTAAQAEMQQRIDFLNVGSTQASISELVDKARADGPDIYKLRSAICARLSSLIECVIVSSAGSDSWIPMIMAEHDRARMKTEIQEETQFLEPAYIVKFKNGELLFLHPYPGDPKRVRHTKRAYPVRPADLNRVG